MRTISRVLYDAFAPGVTDHLPSSPSAPFASYDVAVPCMKNSFSRYPYCDLYDASIAFIGMSGVPPVTGPMTVGTATAVLSGRVDGSARRRGGVVGVRLLARRRAAGRRNQRQHARDAIAARIVTVRNSLPRRSARTLDDSSDLAPAARDPASWRR